MVKIQEHTDSCQDCNKELEDMKALFFDMAEDEMEQPSPSLRSNFEEMLASEKAKASAEQSRSKETKVISIQERRSWKSYLQVAASILIVVSAFLIGKYSDPGNAVVNPQVASILTQIEDQSASQRIAAMNLSEEIETTDKKIIQAIVDRLLYDEKPSVRLAAVEALAKFSSLEMVKQALIKSLETDKDPAIQIELIQVLVKIQEKRALPPMKRLLDNEDVPQYVKKEIQFNIPSLS